LSGGSGADTFIFTLIDSGVGKGNRDIINDFDVSIVGEVMDLSAIGNLNYIGTQTFSAINQVRYEMDFVNSTTIVKLNLDNDPKTTEMEIELTGFKNLTADDFVLSVVRV
ncbi:MAG: M10 family metallopeptidase C-terminal domain-containing protein, partial [Methylococcales bacterium]